MRYLLCLLLVFGSGAATAAESLSVFVSILPQKFFVEQIGGDRVRVAVMVEPGQSAETYEPRPRQMAALSSADLFYRVGMPFEEIWMGAIQSANPEMAVLDARQDLVLREMTSGHGHADDHDHAAGERDPHIWLSPANVRVMIARLRDQLIALDPEHAPQYNRNHERFDRELVQLEAEIGALLAPFEGRQFMVFHPSWGYFADAFGLRQLPIESEGKEPGARGLGQLIEQAKAQQIKVVFVQPQSSQVQARTLASALGARLAVIDPLAESYLENMRRVAMAIHEAYQ